jgi:hypothetical protein
MSQKLLTLYFHFVKYCNDLNDMLYFVIIQRPQRLFNILDTIDFKMKTLRPTTFTLD